jgi:hypothetical protein
VTVEEIVADAHAALADGVWPAHELDDDVTQEEVRTMYLGAAGMVWALRQLGAPVDIELSHDGLSEPGLLVGEAGVLVVTRSDDARLQELVDANERNPSWELLWGSPGTILAAKAAGLEWRPSAEILLAEWDAAADGLWTNVIGGKPGKFLGPAHGFAGNVHALRGLLSDDELRARIEPVLREHAVWDGDAVNWPAVPDYDLNRVQWCHGAPGIVATLGDLLPEDMLLGGAETTWLAGPLDKGPGLCHGTAGNGYALLRTYTLTGDRKWLDRARTFADAALGQAQRRYSLFTGDIGAALFARACETEDARFPIMDVL